MSRSQKQLPSVCRAIRKHIERGEKKSIKTFARWSVITPDMVGLIFLVHNGKKFIPVYVGVDMIGHKLGEFALTRTFKGHNVDKVASKKKG